MSATADGSSRCPQCDHPVTINATTCPGCSRAYHIICLKQGCNCGGKAKRKADHLLAVNFIIGLAGVGAAVWMRGPSATASPLFWPAVGLGVVGFLAALARKQENPEEASTGHTASQILFLPAIAAMVVAARGREFPGFVPVLVVGVVGLVVALLGILKDADRSSAMLSVMLAAHTYLVAGVVLSPAFPLAAFQQVKAIAKGKASITAPMGKMDPRGDPERAFRISGVMNVGGQRQALTSKGAFGAGMKIPDVGVVKSVSDAEVVIDTGGQLERYPVPQ